MAGTPTNSTFKPAPSNTLGLVGFLLSLLTCGALSPIGLILSLIALRKSPRVMAILGTILGLLGVGGYAIMISSVMLAGSFLKEEVTRGQIKVAIDTINAHKAANNQQLPENIEGIKLVQDYKDAWGESLRYDRTGDKFKIRSSGPDKKMDTPDDIVSKDFEADAPLELEVGIEGGEMDGPVIIPEDGGAPEVKLPGGDEEPKDE